MKNIILTLCTFALCTYTLHAQVDNKNRSKTEVKQSPATSSSLSDSPYKALGHYWHNARKDNLTTSAENGKILARRENYKFVRYDGFIFRKAANNEGQAVPLYLYYHRGRQDYFTTATTAGIGAAEASGYKKVATEGYVLKTVKVKFSSLYKPLWLYYCDARKDNFVTASEQGLRDAKEQGYRRVRIEGYVRKTDKPNRLISIMSAPDPVKAEPPPPSRPKPKPPCRVEKMEEIYAPAIKNVVETVVIDCSCTFSPDSVITKRLVFNESNVICDCNGATLNGGEGTVRYEGTIIEVRSKTNEEPCYWSRPENITIKNCNIIGPVVIYGMGSNGQSESIRESSRRERTNSKHIQRVRNNAPKNIVFDDVTITGVGKNPLYFSPGVTYSKIINSEIKGKSNAVGIYLDTESAYNTIKNNYIHVETPREGFFEGEKSRPQIAIDGSSRNKIINNKFAELYNGGIYLYRNCGEGGTIRHTPPEHNIFINNVFIYEDYGGRKPAIYLGSRNGNRNYCDKDEGWAFGSSISNKDFARYNVIMQNQFYKKPANTEFDDMVQSKNSSNNSPNYLAHNEIVTTKINRKAGCYVENGYKEFLLHGESIDVFNIDGKLTCASTKSTCNDGELIIASTDCEIVEVPFECIIESNNNGCSKTISAPAGKKIVGVKIACNLEFGIISNSQLSAVPLNQIKVVMPSDNQSDGSCFIGENSIRKGAKTLFDIQDQVMALFGCKEHDENGGDCHIKGILYCR